MNTAKETIDIKLECIIPSKLNPRQTFSNQEIEQLAANMKEKGQGVPIAVRAIVSRVGDPLPTGQYELIDGERRLKAAKIAGLPTLRAEVHDLTDDQANDLRLILNDQREGLHPLEQMKALVRLQKEKRLTAEQLASTLSKPVGVVTRILSLAKLSPNAENLFRDGVLTLKHAEVCARYTHELQDAVLKSRTSRDHGKVTISESASSLAVTFQQNSHQDLTKAQFDTDDATLNQKAGSCTTCPKRTGNQPMLFDDVRSKNECTDSACYQLKLRAFINRQFKTLQEQYETQLLLVKKDPKAHAPTGKPQLISLTYERSGGATLSVREFEFAKDVKPIKITKAIIVHAWHQDVNRIGEVVDICLRGDYAEQRGHGGQSSRPQQTPEQRTKRKKELAQERLNESLNIGRINAFLNAGPTMPGSLINLLFERTIDAVSFDDWRLMCRVLGVEPKKGMHGYDFSGTCMPIMKKWSDRKKVNFCIVYWILADVRNDLSESILEELQVLLKSKNLVLKTIDKKSAELHAKALAAKDAARKAKSKKSAKKSVKEKHGVCRVCGCTETTPCILASGPCAWANAEQTLCDNPKCVKADKRRAA